MKSIVSVICLHLFLLSTVKAQNFECGLSYQEVHYEGRMIFVSPTRIDPRLYTAYNTVQSVKGILPLGGVNVGYHYPFFIRNELSFGAGLYGRLGVWRSVEGEVGVHRPENASKNNLMFQSPLYFNIRYGDCSSKKAQKKWGAGFGFGYMLQTFNLWTPAGDRGTQIVPSVKAQISYKKIIAVVDQTFDTFESSYSGTAGEIPKLKYNNWGVSLLYAF